MVESEAQELSEDVMLGAVVFGHQQMQVAINTINELVAEAGKPKWTWAAPAADANMVAELKPAIGDRLNEAFFVRYKLGRTHDLPVMKTRPEGSSGGDGVLGTGSSAERRAR